MREAAGKRGSRREARKPGSLEAGKPGSRQRVGIQHHAIVQAARDDKRLSTQASRGGDPCAHCQRTYRMALSLSRGETTHRHDRLRDVAQGVANAVKVGLARSVSQNELLSREVRTRST